MGTSGPMAPASVAQAYGGNIQQPGGWWTAFGTGGFEGEPPLLEGETTYGFRVFRLTPSFKNWESTFHTFERNL